jgi:hypothetical protein
MGPHVRLGVRGPKKTGGPGFPATGRHRHPRVRLSSKKAAWSSSTPTRSTGNPGEAPPKPFTKAYPEPVVTRFRQLITRTLQPTTIVALMFALLGAQAASFVCSAQCLQHLQATQQAPAMTHCHTVLPPTRSAATQTCPPTATSVCVTDLLADNQQKTLIPPTIQADAPALFPILTVAAGTPVPPRIRSSIGDPPLITPLRI